ncbi:MAG: hypothetical protein K2L88_03200, partial [Clostridiales bacterium]|nr:hypothetical protein [Clostridiales bacterium]
MNTKNYLKMFEGLAENGELPRELYDSLVAKIQERGKMTKDIYDYYLTELEKRRLFDVDGAPFDTNK